MDAAERQAAVSLPIILAVGALVAFAGSTASLEWRGVPIFALCAAAAFALNWLVFVFAFLKRSDHLFDITGSVTYVSVTVGALLLAGDFDPRSVLLASLVVVWAGRLGSFLLIRITRAGGTDIRFQKIKESFVRFLMAWTLQGLWVLFTAACALAAITSETRVPLGVFAAVGGALWLFGFGLEVIADRQKSAFNADPEKKGRFINTGLWAWSRHPNYLGEITLWAGIAVIAFPALSGWQLVTLISPVFVYVLLGHISGVPLLERRAKKKWGHEEAYQAYVRSTPKLLLKPPARASST